ncbi:MAG: phosphate ABC transporter permease subunit PstC [Xanthomonadales bacterium]|nr:phosphate ABC transporter permease subunit PstC [Xanthomonadales bacterium]
MNTLTLLTLLAAFALGAFYLGRRRSLLAGGGARTLHSLPGYYGFYVVIWCLIPPLGLMLGWQVFEPRVLTWLIIEGLPESMSSLPQGPLNLLLNDIRNLASGDLVVTEVSEVMTQAADRYTALLSSSKFWLSTMTIMLALAGISLATLRITPAFRARNKVESTVQMILIVASSIAILTTVGIVFSVLFESIRFFQRVPLDEFLFGLQWSPQMAIRADQVGSSGAFGFIPLLTGTLLITAIAMVVAVPIGLMTAVYLTEYAKPAFRSVAKPLLEVLAGIPTVVYGFFAAIQVAPFIRDSGGLIGLDVASESALAAGIVMGIMIIPLVSSLSDDAITAVPAAMRDGSLALGATRSETVKQVMLPAALPGIVGGVLLAVSRAIGETMIVVMAAGLAANLTANPLEAVTTVTVQIVTLLVGDQEFDSAKTLAAFALGLMLFLVTLVLNVIGLRVVRKYREAYE